MADTEPRAVGTDKNAGDTNPIIVPAAVAAVMLLGALGGWPYGYFMLLRWITCIAAIIVAYNAAQWKCSWAMWTFGFIAILFNPLMPIYLTRSLWQRIDIGCAVLFLAAIFWVRPRS